MVNLNRQIGVSQARQGGFSSHVLPEPVGYQPPPRFEFTPRQNESDQWMLDAIGEWAEPLSVAGDSGSTYQQAGAVIAMATPSGGGLARLELAPTIRQELGTSGPLTVEAWLRLPQQLGGVSTTWFYSGAASGATDGTTYVSTSLRKSSGATSFTARFEWNPTDRGATWLDAVVSEDQSDSGLVHVRGVMADRLASLAVNGVQVASFEEPVDVAFQDMENFAAGVSATNTASGEIGMARLYHAALPRDNFTPPQL